MINNLIPLQLQICISLMIAGFLIRQSLLIVGQNWVVGYHHLVTYILLPCIAYVITTVIANNIALSLGMIGALSIVRFRNPVKSPLELVIFFALLTLGIAASVQSNYSYLLFFVIILSIFGSVLYNYIFNKIGLTGYQVSFNEGVSLNLLDVSSKEEIPYLNNSKNLIFIHIDKEKEICEYRLGYNSKKSLNEDINFLKTIDNCSIKANFSS